MSELATMRIFKVPATYSCARVYGKICPANLMNPACTLAKPCWRVAEDEKASVSLGLIYYCSLEQHKCSPLHMQETLKPLCCSQV